MALHFSKEKGSEGHIFFGEQCAQKPYFNGNSMWVAVCWIIGQEPMLTTTELVVSLEWGLGSADKQIKRQKLKGLDSEQKTL